MAVLVLLSLQLVIFTLNSEILMADDENRCGDGWDHVKRDDESRVFYLTEGGRKIPI